MRIERIGEPKIIMSNPFSKHNYFGWPTVTRLKNGKIAVVASGFRLQHICPFGKTVISYSDNDGESYTLPAPVIDTSLDDRDGGIIAFGQSGVIVTSFNNSISFQEEKADGTVQEAYRRSYLAMLNGDDEQRYLGSTFRVSFDNGVTFGKLYKSPITSPHGPITLSDGSILWVGRTFSSKNSMMKKDCVCAYRLFPNDGRMDYLGCINDVYIDGVKQLSCEPATFELTDGTILCQFRVQSPSSPHTVFTTYQATSRDGGKNWSIPQPVLSRCGGAPAHIMRHSSGVLISTYGYRSNPYGIRAMFSVDDGKTWDTDYELYLNEISADLGYPSTVECGDGSLLTVFYARLEKDGPAVIMQQKWRFCR